MPRSITAAGLKFLLEVKASPRPAAEILKAAWPESKWHFFKGVPFALKDDGLITTSDVAPEVCSLTSYGEEELARKGWVCGYCDTKYFGMKSVKALFGRDCKKCKGSHVVCKSCWRHLVVVGGEFPGYTPTLRVCPSDELRIALILKKPVRKKKGVPSGEKQSGDIL